MAIWPKKAVMAHIFGGSSHTADTLANINAKVTDAIIASESYVQTYVQGIDYQNSVLSRVTNPTGSELDGDRYIIIATASGVFVGEEDKIAQANKDNPTIKADWDFFTPSKGWTSRVEDETTNYNYNDAYPAGNWIDLPSTILFSDLDFTGSNLTSLANRSHTDLTDLGIDGHTQYLNVARHDLTARHSLGSVVPHDTPTGIGFSAYPLVNADIDAAAAIAWTKVSKTGSNLTDLVTRNYTDLQSIPSDFNPAAHTIDPALGPHSGTLPLSTGVSGHNLGAHVLGSVVPHETWAGLDKTVSDIADITTRNHTDLSFNVNNDDHLQYSLRYGRTGGQELSGGVNVGGGYLVLRATLGSLRNQIGIYPTYTIHAVDAGQDIRFNYGTTISAANQMYNMSEDTFQMGIGNSDMELRIKKSATPSNPYIDFQDSVAASKFKVDKDGNITLAGNVDGMDLAAHVHTGADGSNKVDYPDLLNLPSLFDGVFTSLDFTGSNLTSLATRSYNDLQNLPSLFDGVFNSLDFTGSNLTSLVTRNYNDLQSIPSSFTPSLHTIGGSAHSADTLANLNAKVSDATLEDKIKRNYMTAGPYTSIIPTDLATGSIRVPQGDVLLHSDSAYTTSIEKYTISQKDLVMTDNSENYIYADYSAGSPDFFVTLNPLIINGSSQVPIARAYREGTVCTILTYGVYGKGFNNELGRRMLYAWDDVVRESGLTLSDVATRKINIDQGYVWFALARRNLDTAETGAIGVTTKEWYHSAGVWTSSTVTQYNNTDYDNGTNKVALTSNRYAVIWVYRLIDGKQIHYVLGNGDYTEAQSLDSSQPAIPTFIHRHCILVGRMIIQKAASSSSHVQGAFVTEFAGVSVVAHSDLSGVSIDQHHAQDHETRHRKGGADEITVENLATSGTAGQVLSGTGSGVLAMQTRKIRQMLNVASSYPALFGGNTSGYVRIGSAIGITVTEDYGKRRMPACTVIAINGRCSTISSTIIYTVRKNGVNTTLTGTVSATGVYRITGSVAFSDGDEISIAYSTTAGGGVTIAGIVIEYETELI